MALRTMVAALLATVATAMPTTSPLVACDLPEEPNLTFDFVPEQDPQCSAGGVMPGDGSEPRICDVQCRPGFAQGVGGAPLYFCNNGDLTLPTITCVECPIGTYQNGFGENECLSCPADSTTLEAGSTLASDCLCLEGFAGDSIPRVCTPCPVGTFKDTVGTEACVACPAGASTEEPASTSFANCLCTAGSTGPCLDPEDCVCTDCEEDFFKPALGPAACTACPADSTTRGETGGDSFGSCLCDGGFGGTIQDPESVCTLCEIGEFSTGGGNACNACPDVHQSTLETGSSLVTDCICIAGFEGADGTSCTTCPFNQWSGEMGSTCTACPLTINPPQESCVTLRRGATAATDCKCGFCSCTGLAGEVCTVNNLFYNEGADAECRPDETGTTKQRILVQGAAGVTEIDLTGLGRAESDVVIVGNENLTSLNLGSFTFSEYDLVIGGNTKLTVLNTILDTPTNVNIATLPEGAPDFPACIEDPDESNDRCICTSGGGSIIFGFCVVPDSKRKLQDQGTCSCFPGTTTCNTAELFNTGGPDILCDGTDGEITIDIIVQDNPTVVSLDFSNIVEAGANIQIENCPALTTILLGALATVEGRITVTNNGVLVNFDAGQLTTVTTGIEVRDNAQLSMSTTQVASTYVVDIQSFQREAGH